MRALGPLRPVCAVRGAIGGPLLHESGYLRLLCRGQQRVDLRPERGARLHPCTRLLLRRGEYARVAWIIRWRRDECVTSACVLITCRVLMRPCRLQERADLLMLRGR